MSATGMPSAPCLRMNAFCASENLDAFIALRSSQPGNHRGKTLTKKVQFRGLRAKLVVKIVSERHLRPSSSQAKSLVKSPAKSLVKSPAKLKLSNRIFA